MRRLATLAGAALAALVGHGATEVSAAEYLRRQQKAKPPTRSQRRSVKQQAVDELVRLSQDQVVLSHIHPRWLRAEVERRMDLGETITAKRVDELRAMGYGR